MTSSQTLQNIDLQRKIEDDKQSQSQESKWINVKRKVAMKKAVLTSSKAPRRTTIRKCIVEESSDESVELIELEENSK